MTEDTKNILTECVHRLENVAATTSMTESYEINRIIGVIEALVEVEHCFILNDTGHKMTYCPKSGLVSFNHNDFRYRYCHFCKEYMNRNYNSYQ